MRKLVRVEPHEVAIMRDNKGAFTFHGSTRATGTSDESGAAFHIPPFSELVILDADHRSVYPAVIRSVDCIRSPGTHTMPERTLHDTVCAH